MSLLLYPRAAQIMKQIMEQVQGEVAAVWKLICSRAATRKARLEGILTSKLGFVRQKMKRQAKTMLEALTKVPPP